MPLFSEDIQDNSRLQETPKPSEPYTGPAQKPVIPSYFEPGTPIGNARGNGEGMNMDDIVSSLEAKYKVGPSTPLGVVSTKTLEDNERYSLYRPGVDYEDIYSQAQSGWDRIANAGIQFTNKVGAYLTQTAGFIAGAPFALVGGTINLTDELFGGEGKVVSNGNAVSNMTDNFLTNLGDVWKEKVAEYNPIYKSYKYTHGNIWDKLSSTDWWLDDAVDRLALTASMIIPGVAEARGIGLWGMVADEAGVLRATGAGSKMVQALADNPELYGKIGKVLGNQIYKTAVDGVVDIGAESVLANKALAFKNAVQTAQKLELYSWNVIGQSALNGREAQVSIRRALHEQREQGLNNFTEEEIESKAAEGAAKGFWYTVPVALSASIIELPMIFSTAKTAESTLKKFFNPKTLEVLEDAAKTTKPSLGWTLGKSVLVGIEHGPINENLQVAIGRYLEDSIAGKVKDGKIVYDTGNPFTSILYDWVDNVNDPNGQNNIALGFIQGMLMTTGGYAKSIIKGEYAAKDAQNQRYLEIINKAKAQRRFWTTPEEFIERDEADPSKIKVDEKGQPVFNQQKLADMGMSLAGAADAYQKRIKAIKENDQRTLDELNKDSLTALSQNFFDDPKGMEYLTNLLRFEAKNQRENINRVNDSQNGIEHTPEYQLQENLAYVEKLKKAYDAIENRHAGFTALDVNLKDPNEVKARAEFIEAHRNAQYFVGAKQLFLMDRIQKNNTELGGLGITEFVKEPSNPSEERANQLIEENERNQQELDKAKDDYKFLIDKEQFKERFNIQRDKYRAAKEAIENQKANAAAEAERQANMTPEELAASKKVKIKTKTGESEYEIGEEYYVGTVIVGKDTKGFEEISFPKIVILKDNGDGTIRIKDAKGERDITKAALESYKLGKMSEIEKDKKAKFFYENRNTLFQFNFGKGNKVEGRLEYSPKDRILVFKYFDKKGKLREIEVTGDQFVAQKGYAQAMITPVGKITAIQEKALSEYAAEKDSRTFDKRTARLKILDQLFDETSAKLDETKKLLQRKYTEFEKITSDLTVIENKIKGGELTKRLNFKRTTAKAIQTANRLSRMQEELRKEIQSLEAEQENLESLQSYVADMAQNIDVLPTDSKEFLNELREQVLDLGILQEETGKQINAMSKLIDQTEGALNKAMEFVRELITKFEQTYPKTPTAIVGQEWVNFLKANPNFLKINTNFKEDLATVEDIISQIDDLDIIPGERTVAELRAELDGIMNTLADVEKELAAKEKILAKFEGYAAEYQRVQEEEAAISKNEELINDVIGTLNKGTQNLQFDTKYEADPKKATDTVMRATTFPTEERSGTDALLDHHQRANRFGSRFPQIKGKGKNIRGVIVTAKNESAVIPGLTEFLKQGKASVDASTTIALVMVEKGDDGVLHLVDENGERITKEQGLEKGIFQVFPMDISDMFRDGTEKYIIDGYSKQFKEWRTKQLANTEITDYNVDASFGVPDNIKKLDAAGNPMNETDFSARVAVEDSGLITQADLAKNPMINVPTIESTITLGTTSFRNALGGVFLRLTNGYVKLNNRQHTAKEANAIYDAIHRLSSIMVKDKTIKSEEAQRIVDWLRTVVFWGSPKEGKAPGYNAVYFDKGEDGKLKLYMSGKNQIVSEFTPTQIELNKGSIIALLQEMYNNTFSKSVDTEWKKPYEQIISISKDGTIERVMWPNYQTYLLSNKQADGKTARNIDDIPLSTRMRPLKNAEDTNRKGIYFIIDDAANDASFIKPEAPQKVTAVITPGVPKAPAPKTEAQAATTAKFVLDGATENTIALKAGNIKFVYDPANPDSFKKIDIDKTAINELIDAQKEKGITITEDEAFSALSQYALKQIKADIEATKVSKEAGKPPITTPPLAFVLDGKTENTIVLKDTSEIKFVFDENQVVEPGELPTIKSIKVPDSKVKELMESKGITEKEARSAYDNYVLKQVAAFQQSKKQAEAPKVEEKKEEVTTTPVTETKTTPVEAPKSADQVDSEIKKRIAERKGRVGKDVDLRVFVESQAGKFERENWDNVEKAVKQMFPNVPVYRVKNMLKGINGVQAWGMFKDGAIYIYENAEVGTAYHEIFEAVWKMVTPPAEQAAIRNEFKNREGSFTDRPTGKTIKYSEATDQQIKEQLAEEFRDYIHEGKLPPKPKDGRPYIVKLFADLLNMIKSLFIGKAGSKAERLFKNIEKGKYRNYVPAESTLSYANKGIMDINDAYITKGAELREFPGLTNENVHDAMQQMTFVTLSYLMDDNQALFNIPDINKTELYTTLKENLLDRVVQQIVAAEDMVAEGQFTQQEVQHIIDNAEMLYQNIENNWDTLKEKHEEYLKTYSIEFDENDELALNNDEKSKEDPYGDANKIDHFRKANSAVKLILATLPMVDSKGNRQVSSVGGVKLIPLSEAYMAVINNVHDSVNEDAMIEGIRKMAIADKNYERLYSRLTKSPSSTNVINWDAFNEYDLKLLMSFLGTFNKQNPDVKLMNILAGGEVQITDSNFSTAARQVKNDFINDIRGVIKDKNPFFEFSTKEKGYVKKIGKDKKDPFDKIVLGDDESRIKFLSDLGIVFTKDDVTRLKYLGETERFNKAVAGILSSMKVTDKIATISGTVLSIDGRLLTLGQLKAKLDNPEFSSTYYGVKGEKIQTYIGTNPSSDLYKALSSIKNINELATDPKYKQYSYLATDAFVKNSVILKAMFEPTTGDRISQTENLMKASVADGYINLENGKRKPSSKQTYKERVIQEINMNLDGYYYTLVPGDASMEWMTYMGNHISESVLKTGWESVHDVFKGYLIDEINLAREQRDIVTPKKTDRKTTDLRFFKSIFENKESKKPNEIHNDIVTLALEKNKDGSFKYTAEEIYNNNKNKVDSAVEKYIKKETQSFKKTLSDYSVILKGADGEYITSNLKFAEKNEITEEDLNRNLNALTANFMINNIELHKLLYSDPYQYSDELKRIKNFLSPRQNMIHGSLMLNAALDRVWNRGFESTDIGYTDMTKDYFKTTTLEDILGTHDLDGYRDALYEEANGSGIISFKAYRNFRIRTNDWNEAEESQYRYDVAWEKRDKRLDLTPRDQEILDKGNPGVRSAYTARKPIVAGNKANGKSYNDVMLDKYAIYPLSYRVMKEINPTANSLKLYNKMQEEGIDYVVFESGRKVGSEEKNMMYTKTGEFNNEAFKGIVNVPFAIMSVQSEVPSKEVSMVTRGSQATKEMTMDFMEGGVPIDFMTSGKNINERYQQWLALDEDAKEAASPLYKEIKNNENIIKELMEVGYQNVLKRLGMKDVNGKIEITEEGKSKAAETLREEILKREVNDNIADALIGFLKGDVVLEATPAYQQIRNILYSIADKEVISPKISGRMLVQIPSTFMESNRIESVEVKDKNGNIKQAYASDVLKFYVDEDGKRTCEVMLGRWFESNKTDEELMDYFNNTEEGKKQLAALAALAFRIPTQKQNSIESIKIAKFLPQEFGDNIIIPAALVQKAGSDFDIDKLTTYLKNMYIGRDGYPRMINFLTDENSTAEERYVHWVRENSNRDTQKYVRFLSRQYVQNLKSNFEIEAAKINAKYQEIRKERVEDLFDDMQSDIARRKISQLGAQDSYMEELFNMGKKVFWRMEDATRDPFWAVRDYIRQQGIKGPEEIRRYLALATSMIQDPRTIQDDIVRLEGLQKIYTEELRVMGIMEETIDNIVKNAITEFRKNKNALSNVLKMEKAPEFESLNDIYEDARSQQSFEGSQEIANIDGLASFDEFKTFSKYKQNVDKALQNAYIESSANLVSSKENFAQLIKPNSADQLKGLANEISELRGLGSFEYTSVGNMLSKNFMSRLRHAFVSGKYAIGIAAVSQTNHSLNQRQPIYYDFSKLNQIDDRDAHWMLANGAKINFVDGKGKPLYNTMQIDGKTVPTLSMIKNIDGQYISDIVAQFIDGYVDISKGPWIMELGATPNVASTFLMLAKLGVPIDTVAYFMNQPIIRDYLRSIETSGYSYLFMQQYVDQIKNSLDYKEGISQVDKVTSIPNNKELKASIKAKKLSPIQKAEQIYMLDEFLKYAKMAEQLFTVTQGTNFDTANFNDPYLVFKKAVQLEKARNTILSSPNDTAADALLKGSFLGDLAQKIGSVRDAMSNILTSDQGEIRDVMEDVLRDYVDLPDREFVGVAQKAVNDFFDWAVQINDNRNTFIERLLTADDSGAKKIADLKKAVAENPNHPLYNNYLIGKNGILETQMSSKNKGVDNISIKNKGNKVYDQNQIIYSFREIKKYVDEGAYKVLVGTSILQSGLSNSRISFTSLLPYEDFKKVYHDTLSNIKNLSNINIRDYYTLNVFERNNWADDDIIPRDKANAPRRSATGKLIYNTRMKWFGDKQSKAIDKAIDQGKIPKLLKVSDLSRVGNSNFVVYSWEDMSISKAEKTKMKQAGDYSYINKGLFKKVYYADDTPVTTSYVNKKTGIEYTSYVYKMINAWGDSFRANEFYNTPRTSVIDNGFMKVEETSTTIETAFGPEEIKTSPERSDEVIASYFSRDEIGDYNLAPEELLEDYSQKTGKTMGTETQISSADAESLKAQIAEIENKKKTTGLTPSEIATLSQMQTELGKIIKSQC